MSFGLEVYDDTEQLLFSTEGLTTSYIGVHTPTTRSGSITVPSGLGEVWALGQPWRENFGDMEVWVEGNVIRWQMFFAKVGEGRQIVYGRFSK